MGIYIYHGLKQTIWLIEDSVRRALFKAVEKVAPESSVGVAFSGGLDSTLLAKICSDLGKKVLLITTGFPGAHDLEFSKGIGGALGIPQRLAEINPSDFAEQVKHVQELIGCANTSHVENCVAYHYIAAAARRERLSVVLSANGCDELFCGYNMYRLEYGAGPERLLKLMDEKIANELLLVQEISSVAGEFGVEVRQPFLDPEFIAFAKTVPLDGKITGPDDMLRKHVLRRVALDLKVPEESAMKPKKALQYGSSIHKHFQNVSRQLRGRPGGSKVVYYSKPD